MCDLLYFILFEHLKYATASQLFLGCYDELHEKLDSVHNHITQCMCCTYDVQAQYLMYRDNIHRTTVISGLHWSHDQSLFPSEFCKKIFVITWKERVVPTA